MSYFIEDIEKRKHAIVERQERALERRQAENKAKAEELRDSAKVLLKSKLNVVAIDSELEFLQDEAFPCSTLSVDFTYQGITFSIVRDKTAGIILKHEYNTISSRDDLAESILTKEELDSLQSNRK